MNDPLEPQPRELSWRQQLTQEERAELQAYLELHPEARQELELEEGLTRLLAQAPDAPQVASNFTAQVMQSIQREKADGRRQAAAAPSWGVRLRSWLPRIAVAGLVAVVGVVGVHERQVHQRALMADRVERVAEAFSSIGQEPVQNFEPISRMAAEPPAADTELSTLMASVK